ncbi:acyltransferase family protein [Spongisporangium articulatum]|uniref:Acyltransferase family protein n=1 Tax=Spongisporangium articulatum TaxID=3362603 RepID=A0ABW8AN84_9ACTN
MEARTPTVSDPHDARTRPTPAPAVRSRFTELDGLRGVAALAVIFFHLRDYVIGLGAWDWVGEIVGGSYMMVDLFFVLSGFVLSKKMLSTATAGDARRFVVARVRRFAPLHVTAWSIALALCLMTFLWQLTGDPDAPRKMAFAASDATPWAWVSSLFLLHGFVGPEFASYSAAWSLSVELYLNVLIVVAIALVPRVRLKPLVGPAMLVLGAVLLLSRDHHDPNTVGFIGVGRGALGLGAGMIVYQLYLRTIRTQEATHGTPGSPRSRHLAAAGSMLAVGFLIASMYRSDLVKREHFLLMALVGGFAVYTLAVPSAGPVHRFCNTRLAQWLGTRSFALYALHGPMLMCGEWLMRFLDYNKKAPQVEAFLIVWTIVLSLAAAEVGHRWIERSWEQHAARQAARSRPEAPVARHARASTPEASTARVAVSLPREVSLPEVPVDDARPAGADPHLTDVETQPLPRVVSPRAEQRSNADSRR